MWTLVTVEQGEYKGKKTDYLLISLYYGAALTFVKQTASSVLSQAWLLIFPS